MLPPLQETATGSLVVCPPSTPSSIGKVLTWNGTDAIKCQPALTVDDPASGDVSVSHDLFASRNISAGGSVKVGNDASPCTAPKAGSVRWTGTAMEYCNGTQWVGFAPPSLAIASTSYTGASIGFVHDTTRTIASGTFLNADGYIGADVQCGGGNNRLSAYLTVNGTRVASVTAHDIPAPADYWEIDNSSLFSYVPKNAPWTIVVRASENTTKNGGANCTLFLRRFGS